MRRGRAATIAALLLASAPAWAASDLLKNARNTFEYGSYEEADRLAEALLSSHQLGEEHDLVEAYRIAGLSNFYLNRPEVARRQFVALLSVEPDYAMDPFLVPPAAVAFFDGVKRDNESLLLPIRERRKAMAEQERLAEEARRRLLDENLRRQIEPDRPIMVQRVETHTFLTNFVPFGAGQFQENRPVAGTLLASAQVLGLATFAFSFAKIEGLRDDTGKFAHADLGTAQNFSRAKWTGLAVFGAAALFGVADSLWRYEPVTSRIEALPQPRSRPAPQSTPPPASGTLQPQLIPWASSRALGLDLALRF
jgi:hypothetical protein